MGRVVEYLALVILVFVVVITVTHEFADLLQESLMQAANTIDTAAENPNG